MKTHIYQHPALKPAPRLPVMRASCEARMLSGRFDADNIEENASWSRCLNQTNGRQFFCREHGIKLGKPNTE